MDSSILIAIVSATSVLLGGAMTAYFQTRSLKQTQQFQLKVDAEKYGREQISKHQNEAIERILAAYKALSFISREFSITNIDILWRLEIPEGEYDQRYIDACLQLDSVSAFAGMLEPDIKENVNKLSGQMNMFWGNFKNLLYQTSQGKTPHEVSDVLSETHVAARKVSDLCYSIQCQLSEKSKVYRNEN